MNLLRRHLFPYPTSGSGAVSTPDVYPFDKVASHALKCSFAISGTVSKGQEVAITSNGTIVGRGATLSVRPIGVVDVGNDINTNNTMASVYVYGDMLLNGIAKGGTLAVGAFVSQDNTRDSSTYEWNYITAASGTYATGVVVSGGAAGVAIKVLALPQPVLI